MNEHQHIQDGWETYLKEQGKVVHFFATSLTKVLRFIKR